jgi:hypothetical protein
MQKKNMTWHLVISYLRIALHYTHSSRNNIIETEVQVRLVLDVYFLTCK